MPSVGRKFLMAGRGGLNLTHSEPSDVFAARYGAAESRLAPILKSFPPSALVRWAVELGQPTFVGSSGRVFPVAMKASPLLRAWLGRLQRHGVVVRTRARWIGFAENRALRIEDADGRETIETADAVILALGGAGWPRLGADGDWVPIVRAAGVAVSDLVASNVGVKIAWSEVLREKFHGQPVKRVAMTAGGRVVRGEAVVTRAGLEGGAVYALGPELRGEVAAHGHARLTLDLRPDLTLAELTAALARPRGKQTMANHLRKAGGLPPVAIALVREAAGPGGALPAEAAALAERIKTTTLRVEAIGGLDRAISSAGGIALAELDHRMMLKKLPGVFAAGEMLDWDAPTGGYLLQASFATGVAAARGVLAWLAERPAP